MDCLYAATIIEATNFSRGLTGLRGVAVNS